MVGIFNKKIYDEKYNEEFIKQQTKPGLYVLDKNYTESNNKCVSNFGPRQNKNRSNTEIPYNDIKVRSEIENYLHNLDIPDSRCISLHSLEEKNKRLEEFIKKNKPKKNIECSTFLDEIYSRLDKPVLDSRSKNFNRYEFPIINPSYTTYYGISNTEQINNNRFGVNSRLQAKDLLTNNK